MKLTGRGKRVGAVVLFLSGVGLLFLDPIVLAAALAAFLMLMYDLYDAFSVLRRPERFNFEPASFDARALRENSRSFTTTLRSPRPLSIDLGATPWLRLDKGSVTSGTTQVTLGLSSDFAGTFATDALPADFTSQYGMFSSRIGVPLKISFRVYPRLVAAALAALDYLTRVGVGTEGEVEKNVLGTGMEYAETREYMAGDNLRRVDWKATARTDSLMIKHYYSEGGGAVHVVYFVEAPGSRSHDEMATQLLDLVVSAAVRVTPISVTAYEKGSRLTTFSGKGWEVVISTLNLVMAESKITYDDLYSLLDIVPVSLERRSMILAGKGSLARLMGKLGGRRQALVSDFREVVAQLASPDVMSSFILLSSLVSNRDVLASIIDDLRYRRAETTVVYPPEPWKDAANLSEAYLLEGSQRKMLSFVRSSGCLAGPIPLKLPRMTGIPAWAVSASA